MRWGCRGKGSFVVEDLLTGTSYTWKDQWNYVALRPSEMHQRTCSEL